MMALPHTQYVLADASTPVSATVNSNQVKTVRESAMAFSCLSDRQTSAFALSYGWNDQCPEVSFNSYYDHIVTCEEAKSCIQNHILKQFTKL